jgi:hypothetical protein
LATARRWRRAPIPSFSRQDAKGHQPSRPFAPRSPAARCSLLHRRSSPRSRTVVIGSRQALQNRRGANHRPARGPADRLGLALKGSSRAHTTGAKMTLTRVTTVAIALAAIWSAGLTAQTQETQTTTKTKIEIKGGKDVTVVRDRQSRQGLGGIKDQDGSRKRRGCGNQDQDRGDWWCVRPAVSRCPLDEDTLIVV